MSPKKARTGSPKRIATGTRVPRSDSTVAGPFGTGTHKVTFSFRYSDRGYRGAWTWPEGAAAAELLDFFCNVGALSWTEVKAQMFNSKSGSHRKHHDQDIRTLCVEAQQRIARLQHDQLFGDSIFRFRVGNRKRLWGFLVEGVFYVLWWDNDHAVHPTTSG